MRTSRSLVAALAALSTVLGCSTVDDAGSIDLPAAPSKLTLADGATLEGTVQSTGPEGIVFLARGEAAPRTLASDEVAPLSWYLARTSDPSLTAEDRLALTNEAIDDGLFDAAEAEVARIAALDAAVASEATRALDEGREAHASGLARRSDEALAAGNRPEARRLAAVVLTDFPDTSAAATAQGVIEQLHAEIGDTEPADGAAAEIRTVSTAGSDRQLDDADKYVKRAEKRNLSALQKSGSSAKQSFENAIADYEKALRLLDAVLADPDASVEQRLRAQQKRDAAIDASVDAHVQLASFYMHRGSYPQSQEIARAALELDPESARARQMVDRAEFVSEEAGRARKLGRQTGRKVRFDTASG